MPETTTDIYNPPFRLEKRRLSFAKFRSKGRNGLDLLRTTLQPVQVAGEILAGGSQTVFPPAIQILGAFTFLINVRGYS